MNTLYFDTTYLCKLRWPEHGSAEVCSRAATATLATALHGKSEFYAVGLRKRREGTSTELAVFAANAQFNADVAAGDIRILPITEAVQRSAQFRIDPKLVHILGDALISVQDDGINMNTTKIQTEYLNLASPCFSRKSDPMDLQSLKPISAIRPRFDSLYFYHWI